MMNADEEYIGSGTVADFPDRLAPLLPPPSVSPPRLFYIHYSILGESKSGVKRGRVDDKINEGHQILAQVG